MTRKKVGIITFHASHNYGSMLQAYALQQVIMGMGYDCEVINFRTSRQKGFYCPPFMRGTILGRIKRTLIYLPFICSFMKKHRLFESFLKEKLILTPKEYSTIDELGTANFDFDYYISGSDQIWNKLCFDFDWAYFLPFVNNGKRIAYAPSMGPEPEKSFDNNYASKIKTLLLKYDAISVREKKTALKLKDFTGNDYDVMLDPTLLLSNSYWVKIAGDKPMISGRYIFLYTPWFNAVVFEKAKMLARKLNLRIVVSQLYNTKENAWYFNNDFKLCLPVGPIEFLNLCKFADCTIGLSFHLVVFSILLHTPFYIIDGLEDSRIRNLLKLTGLESRAISKSDENIFYDDCCIDFNEVNKKIAKERLRSLNWLEKSFE